MSSCGQCGKAGIYNVNDVPLCVDCFAKLQDAVARRQEATTAMGHQIAALRADNIRRASAATGIIPPNHPDLLPTTPPERLTVHNIFNIHDSTIGVLTSGQQVSLRNIEINVRSLTRSETEQVALALQQLTKAVAESAQLAADSKAVELT